jgi:hypothetical protein
VTRVELRDIFGAAQRSSGRYLIAIRLDDEVNNRTRPRYVTVRAK